jgi:hypothetical protein
LSFVHYVNSPISVKIVAPRPPKIVYKILSTFLCNPSMS